MRKTQYSGPSRYVRITATVKQDARPADMGSCEEEQPAGWYCTRDFHHNGPCALKRLPASPSGEDAAEQAAAPQGLTDDLQRRVHRALMSAHPNLAHEFAEQSAAAPMATSPQAPAVIEQWQFRVKDVGSPMWTNITHSDANELKDNPAFELRALSLVPPQAPAVDGAEGPSLGVLKATHEGFSFVPHPNAPVIPYEGMSVYAAPLTREAATVPLTERQIVAAWVTRFNYVEDRNAPNAEQIGFYRALLAAAESKTLPRASEGEKS